MEDLTVAAYNDDVSTSVPATLQGINTAAARDIYQRAQRLGVEKRFKDYLQAQHQRLLDGVRAQATVLYATFYHLGLSHCFDFRQFRVDLLAITRLLYITRSEVPQRNPPSVFRWSTTFTSLISCPRHVIYQKHPIVSIPHLSVRITSTA
jgi:hypothetical protein